MHINFELQIFRERLQECETCSSSHSVSHAYRPNAQNEPRTWFHQYTNNTFFSVFGSATSSQSFSSMYTRALFFDSSIGCCIWPLKFRSKRALLLFHQIGFFSIFFKFIFLVVLFLSFWLFWLCDLAHRQQPDLRKPREMTDNALCLAFNILRPTLYD